MIMTALVAVLGLAGCVDLNSPESALGSAYTAVQKGNLADLRETLTGDALAQFGNAAGLAKLQKTVLGLEVRLGHKQYIWGKDVGVRHKLYAYSVQVLAKTKDAAKFGRLLTATVVCDWKAGQVEHARSIDTSTPETTDCRIAELN